jgi:hypothetical protein
VYPIQGFLSETVVTLEGIQSAQRGTYFSQANHHPGLHPILAQRVAHAVNLGLRFMYAPRLGAPKPIELQNDVFAVETDSQQQELRLKRFSQLVRDIEAQGVGMAVVRNLASSIKARLGTAGPWYSSLDHPRDAQEKTAIEKAVAEWADGDTVAAHYAYQNDYLCSEDIGQSAGGPSIFDTTHRTWLETAYGVKFVTLSALTTMV